ncbi:protein white-like isoform X1 [Tenebrio molitor]|uniref:protein white-like isoform X1 n=1 Tax=Tenebrio molitor TaxID=7067 RepID=UPI0036247777
MPQQQFSLSWQNVNVEISEKSSSFWRSKSQKRTILDNVSGSTRSYSLVAIMGSSGSGKTTFLSAISGRRRDKKGILKINNTVVTDEDVRNVSGYLHQEDIFTQYLTPREHLEFMAALRLHNKSKEKRSIIKKLLSDLSLEGEGDTLIKNLSGGQRRRLSLAGELISDPLMLFCDEPTTGLDSYSALVVLQKLHTIAFSGKIVLASIHQPSSQLFHYFNNITLVAEGKLVFQGTKDEAKSFFESLDLHCPSSYNPADFYIDCLNREDISKIVAVFQNRKKQVVLCPHCDRCDNVSLEKQAKNHFFYELKWLLWRCFLDIRRNKSTHLRLYLFVVAELIFLSLAYSQVSLADQDGVQNIEGFMSMIATEFTFTNMYAVINVFPGEIAVFLREKDLYSAHSYFFSKIISMIPLSLISTVLYTTILFLVLTFLDGIYLWLQMTYVMFVVGMASLGLGLAFSAHFSTVEHVELFIGPLETIFFLLGGFSLQLDSVPTLFNWIKYISPFYYSFDSLSNLFWRPFNDTRHAENDTVPYYYGPQILENYGIYSAYDPVPYDILYLHILMAIFCFLGFLGILRKKILCSL